MNGPHELGAAQHWGDEVDFKYECLLELTPANVAALLKSGFGWDDAAQAARAQVSSPDRPD
jgi:hypothetical protein